MKSPIEEISRMEPRRRLPPIEIFRDGQSQCVDTINTDHTLPLVILDEHGNELIGNTLDYLEQVDRWAASCLKEVMASLKAQEPYQPRYAKGYCDPTFHIFRQGAE